MAFNGRTNVASSSTNYDFLVAGAHFKERSVIFDEATATYTPVVGDVFCEKTNDSNKHAKYDQTDLVNLEVRGIVAFIEEDSTTPTPTKIITYIVEGEVFYDYLGTTGVTTAAHIRQLEKDLQSPFCNIHISTNNS